MRSTAETTFSRICAPGAAIFALIDAARDGLGPSEAEQAGLTCWSLFDGDLGDLLKDAAPHLVEFPARSPFRDWWFSRWGDSVGVLVESPVSVAELRRHFRTLTMVRDAERRQYYFRFYDPRVLRTFLPACTPEELARFFGPITCFYCEGDSGRELLAFSVDRDGRLSTRTIPTPYSEAPRAGAASL